MLLRWVLTRDSSAVLSMVNDYGGWWIAGDNVTRIQPHTWDDVIRDFCIDDSLPKKEKATAAVVKAELFVIPARNEIHSALRRGEIDCWARPNGSGDIVKIEPVQWAGLRFRTHDGHDIAVPVDSEKNPLPLPRPLADYLSGSVPPSSLPTVWPDPLFAAEQAMMLWQPRANASATPDGQTELWTDPATDAAGCPAEVIPEPAAVQLAETPEDGKASERAKPKSRQRAEYKGPLAEWMARKNVQLWERMTPETIANDFKVYCKAERCDLLPLFPKRLRSMGPVIEGIIEDQRARAARQKGQNKQPLNDIKRQ